MTRYPTVRPGGKLEKQKLGGGVEIAGCGTGPRLVLEKFTGSHNMCGFVLETLEREKMIFLKKNKKGTRT